MPSVPLRHFQMVGLPERGERAGALGRATHLSENPESGQEAGASGEPLAAGPSLDSGAGGAPSGVTQAVWLQETEDGRHSRDFMTAEDTWLLME